MKDLRMAARRRVATTVVPMAARTVEQAAERAARVPGVGEYGAGGRAAAG